jgi:hypothetical protein
VHSLIIKNIFSDVSRSPHSPFDFTSKTSRYIAIGLLLSLCVGMRIWFWNATHLALEDALITFRYAENIASGNGFVYNIHERILGTTTPLWTLVLAGAKFAGADLFTSSKMLGILLDAITLILIISILYPFSTRSAIFSSLFFATSPAIIPISISGMETSLLLCMMSILLLGYVRKNMLFGIGIALTILTRIDGAIFVVVFAVAGILQDRKWAYRQLLIACLYCAPWYIFSLTYFGSIFPQSLLAKRAVYNLSLYSSAAPFISLFTPFLDTQILKILAKSGLFVLFGTGMELLFKKRSVFLPLNVFILVYCAVFMVSGTYIFFWYLLPPVFISYFIFATGLDWCINKTQEFLPGKILPKIIIPVLLFSCCLINVFLVLEKMNSFREYQQFENGVRRPLGVWLKENAKSGSKIFFEPLGYIGYFAGTELIIWDEVGLVNPEVAELRKNENGWYTKSLKKLNPDYVVQYTEALENNVAEGTLKPLFINDEDRSWFFSNFRILLTIDKANMFPHIKQKEKKFIIFQKVNTTL